MKTFFHEREREKKQRERERERKNREREREKKKTERERERERNGRNRVLMEIRNSSFMSHSLRQGRKQEKTSMDLMNRIYIFG